MSEHDPIVECVPNFSEGVDTEKVLAIVRSMRVEGVHLEDVRRGQFEGLLREAVRDATRRPDVGGPELHPRAGASAVGARNLLVAYNIYLQDRDGAPDVGLARTVAREVRAANGGLYGLKAMGVLVNGRAQVSMNLTDIARTSVARAFAAVRDVTRQHGGEIAEGELIGLVPEEVYEPNAEWVRQTVGFAPELKVLERRLQHPVEWP